MEMAGAAAGLRRALLGNSSAAVQLLRSIQGEEDDREVQILSSLVSKVEGKLLLLLLLTHSRKYQA